MNLEDVRANDLLTKWWAKAYNNVNFREGILKMLVDTHPLRFVDTAPTTTPSSDRRLGMIEGYELALERLRLAAQFMPKTGEMPEATFEPPNVNEEPD